MHSTTPVTGNSATNMLTGGAGNDTLDGGRHRHHAWRRGQRHLLRQRERRCRDRKQPTRGTDTVNSSVTLTLGNNVENLTLTGTSGINGTGNTLNNTLIGNSANNVLTGAAGDDTYDGGAGNDTLTDTSTSSADVYRWGTGAGLDVLTDSGGSADRIDLAAGITSSNLNLTRNGNNLELTVTGFTDKLTINGWYASANNQIETSRFSDGSSALASQVQSLVSAMAAMSAGSLGQPRTSVDAARSCRSAPAWIWRRRSCDQIRPSSTAWQATRMPSSSTGSAARPCSARWHAGSADGRCSRSAGCSGLGTSPCTGVRARPVMWMSGIASSSMRV